MLGSRLDPLYSRIAAELVARISGRATEGAASVKVICWSDQDWRELSVAFGDAGKMESGEFWLGWVPRGRRVINLSYLACLQLDRIAYHDSQLALPATGAAVGALAHEAMHVAGIHNEGTAECYGMQLTATAAIGLGAEREYADQLRTVNFEFDREQEPEPRTTLPTATTEARSISLPAAPSGPDPDADVPRPSPCVAPFRY